MEIYGVIPFFLSFIFACKIYHDFEDILCIIKKKLLLKTINKFFLYFSSYSLLILVKHIRGKIFNFKLVNLFTSENKKI